MAGVETSLAPRRSVRGVVQRLGRAFTCPGDVVLAVRIAYFLRMAPGGMDTDSLPAFLCGLAGSERRRYRVSSAERIIRLRQLWLRRRWFAAANTCYMRALVLYRFLDVGERRLRIHFVVERPATPGGRWRGHAWVTCDGVRIEAPVPAPTGECKEIYVFPSQ